MSVKPINPAVKFQSGRSPGHRTQFVNALAPARTFVGKNIYDLAMNINFRAEVCSLRAARRLCRKANANPTDVSAVLKTWLDPEFIRF